MGLGFRFVAEPPRRCGILGRLAGRPEFDHVPPALPQAIVGMIDEPLLQDDVWTSSDGGVVRVGVHRAEEPLNFSIEDGWLVVDAKTSSCGPGYHAYVVDLLHRAADSNGLRWIVADDSLGACDETGFAITGDFERLQRDMAEQLGGIARYVLGGDFSNVLISLPLGYEPVVGEAVGTPRGPRRREWLERVASSEADTLLAFAAQHFPWWNRGFDVSFYAGWADVGCWIDVPWRTPQTDDERRGMERIVHAFERARELDPGLALPDVVIDELRALIRGDASAGSGPRSSGIGYRRGPMTRRPGRGWSIVVPGWYRECHQDGAHVWVDGEHEVHASTFLFDGGPTEPSLPELPEGYDEPFPLDLEGLQVCAARRIDGDGYVTTSVIAQCSKNLCILTIVGPIDDDRARDLAGTLRFREPSVE